MVIFYLTAVVLRCGRQGETTTLLSRGVAATPLNFYMTYFVMPHYKKIKTKNFVQKIKKMLGVDNRYHLGV